MTQWDEDRKIIEGATRGEWRSMCMGSEGYHVYTDSDGLTLRERRGAVAVVTQRGFDECKPNAAFIAAARTRWPAALSALAAALERIAELEGALSAIVSDDAYVATAMTKGERDVFRGQLRDSIHRATLLLSQDKPNG